MVDTHICADSTTQTGGKFIETSTAPLCVPYDDSVGGKITPCSNLLVVITLEFLMKRLAGRSWLSEPIYL